MAYSKIIHTKSEAVGAIPAPSSLSYGELAINYSDGNIFILNSQDKIELVASTSHDKNINAIKSDIYNIKGDLSNTKILLQEEMRTNTVTVATTSVGGINVGDSIPEGFSLQDFVTMLLYKVYDPTLVDPSVSITSDIANTVEVGVSSYTITANFNRGSINGANVNGIWDPNAFQNFRSGAASTYSFFFNNTKVIDNSVSNEWINPPYAINDGANSFSVDVTTTEDGPQPLNSAGDDTDDAPFPPSEISSSTFTITGARNAFYGTSTTTIPADSSDVRSLSGSKLNPGNNTTFTINIPAGTAHVIFAYPDTVREVSSVKYVEGLNAEVKAAFTESNVDVEGLNNYAAIGYRLYSYTPASPFADSATYIVTI